MNLKTNLMYDAPRIAEITGRKEKLVRSDIQMLMKYEGVRNKTEMDMEMCAKYDIVKKKYIKVHGIPMQSVYEGFTQGLADGKTMEQAVADAKGNVE